MDIRPLTEDFAVSPQIDPADMARIAAAGYRSVLGNRPDDEEAGQPDFATLSAAAQQAGLETRLVPISSGGVTPQAMADFAQALEEMPKPILAYCRTGTRCTMLWTISQHGQRDSDDILRRTAAAGYDMGGLMQQLGKA